jgi:hypothetical protein
MLYKIKISRRAHVLGDPHQPDEIHVDPGPIHHALTLNVARRKAQRLVERLNRRDGLHVPIARTVEIRRQRSRT